MDFAGFLSDRVEMSQLGVEASQEPAGTSRRGAATPTFMDLLREQSDGQDRRWRRKSTLRERLGFKGIGCCGPNWSFRQTTLSVREEDDEEEEEEEEESGRTRVRVGSGSDLFCSSLVPSGSGMNLAAALAAERHHRVPSREPEGNMTPLRVSLMTLLEQTTERENGAGKEPERPTATAGRVSSDSLCCVCMGNKKGAAFIPCGHTFCRACSRDLWLNRGSCPLCNRPILEILDIY